MEGRLEGRAGCFHINATDGAISNKNFYAFIVQEETVIETLTGTANRNLLNDLNLSGKTLYAGAYVTVSDQTNITAITLTSGSVILYNFVNGTTS